MRLIFFLTVSFLQVFSYANSKPMESLEKYNVVLVHGASNGDRGIEALCGTSIKDSSKILKEAYVHQENAIKKVAGFKWNLGEAVTMMGGLDTKDTLTHWLDTEIFEGYRYFNPGDTTGTSPIYIQRSFVNPANSPIANARELGDPAWKGENYCVERRSLIEEAQEVKVGGQEELKRLRTSKNYFNIPSRNILIGYSMGGVAASEYVRGGKI